MNRYGIAKIARKWMITKTSTDSDPVVIVTGNDEFTMRSILDLMVGVRTPESNMAANRYGKLRVGKRTWLVHLAIGDQYVKGVAVAEDEDAVDELLRLMHQDRVVA